MLTHPTGEKVVRYSSNFNTDYADDAEAYFPGDMELEAADTTSLIYLPPMTLFPPELIDDFYIDWVVHGRINAANTTDTHGLTFFVRKCDTTYGYPVDADSGSTPEADGKVVDMVKVTFTTPAAVSTVVHGFMLHLRMLVHCQAPWEMDTVPATNGYERKYDALDIEQKDGTQQRVFARYEITTGTFPSPSQNTTVVTALANVQVATHAWSSRLLSGAMDTLFPSAGGNGVNLWLCLQKSTSAGDVSLTSAVITTTPKVLRPGMVAGQIAIPFITEAEIAQ